MADTDVKIMLFCITTFFLFAFIAGNLPSDVYAYDPDYAYNHPEEYQGLDIGGYQYTTNFTIDDGTFDPVFAWRQYTFDLGGTYWVFHVNIGYDSVRIGRRNYLGIFWISNDWLTFRNQNGTNRGESLTISEINLDYAGDEGWVSYRTYLEIDPAVGCDVNFGFNTSLYSSPEEAMNNQELVVLVGLGLEDVTTTLNAWQLVGAIMFFQLPNIDPLFNALIAFPMWGNFAVALVLFVARFIPLIQGGG